MSTFVTERERQRAVDCSDTQHRGRELERWATDSNTDGASSWLVRVALYNLTTKVLEGQVTGFLAKPEMQVPLPSPFAASPDDVVSCRSTVRLIRTLIGSYCRRCVPPPVIDTPSRSCACCGALFQLGMNVHWTH